MGAFTCWRRRAFWESSCDGVGLRWFGSIDIVYRRSLALWAPFTLTTRKLCWDERWFYIEQTTRSEEGLASTAWVKALLQDRGKNVPPQAIVDMVQPGMVPPPITESMKAWNDLTREKLLEG